MMQGTERTHTVLDPRTLGRPVHLLGRYTDRFRKELSDLFHQRFNRRYRAQFEIGDAVFEMDAAREPQRWLTHASTIGRIGFASDRNVLLCLLAYRYGLATRAQTSLASNDKGLPPKTATEDRLAARVARQLTNAAAAAIEALQPDVPGHEITPEFTPVGSAVIEGGWTLRVSIHERLHQLEGTLALRFDEAWVARLLRGLAPHRDTKTKTAPAQPLRSRLQLTLSARLLEKSIELGRLLDLRANDVIPITIGSADVLIDDARLFTANLAEHKGKLCLTCFEDVE